MRNKFDKKEIQLVLRMLNTLDFEDKLIAHNILNKMRQLNERSNAKSKYASKQILDKRKEDKWYGRDKKSIQTHFDSTARKICKYIQNNMFDEAKELYIALKEEAKLPRYEEQFNSAITEYLNEDMLRFLNK